MMRKNVVKLLMISFLCFCSCKAGWDADDLAKLRGRAKGTIFYEGGKNLEITYQIDGQNYKQVRTKPFSIQSGEMFWVAYDENDKTNILTLYQEPIIENIADYDTTYTLESVNPIITNYVNTHQEITFEYKVNGIEYERAQRLKIGQKLDENKDEYPVIYKKDNPKIAYVLF